MIETGQTSLDLNNEELVILVELLESERTKLLIEIRHTTHRQFRTQLRNRLILIEELIRHCSLAHSPAREEPTPVE